MLSNDYLLAKIGVDTAENEPSKVCQVSERREAKGEGAQDSVLTCYHVSMVK